MDKFTILTAIAIVLLSAAASMEATSCAEKRRDWRPMYFTQMFRHRDIQGLIKGRVARVFPPQHVPHLGHEVITAEIDLECVYRGGSGLETSALVNISGLGHGHDCVDTTVNVGDAYLMFVEPFSHAPVNADYAVQEFNMQKGAFVASNLKMAIVSSVYECRRPHGIVPTTLPPWQSLTPIKQLPWIILPKDAIPAAQGSGLRITPSSLYLLLSLTMAVELLLRC